MNRRQLFAALAALPIIGKIVPARAYQTRPGASLLAYRDLLLPGLRGPLRYPIEADIEIDYVYDALLVKARWQDVSRWEDRRLVVGVISREDLSNQQWKSKFMPLLFRMREALLAPEAPLRFGDDIIVVSDPVIRITMDEIT
jgi:hypothetical protein